MSLSRLFSRVHTIERNCYIWSTCTFTVTMRPSAQDGCPVYTAVSLRESPQSTHNTGHATHFCQASACILSELFSSVTQWCGTLCDPMDCSTPGFSVLHQLPELAQTHIHCIGDAIQPSHPVFPFSSRLQSFPALGSFQVSQFFPSGGQSIGASASVLPMSIQDWFPLGWTGWIPLQSKEFSRVFSNITVQKHQFFWAQLSLKSNSHIHTWLLEKSLLWLDWPLLAKECLCFLIFCLGWS